MEFKLGSDSLKSTKKSLKSLKSHIQSTSGVNEPVYLTINTINPLIKSKEYTPRVIPLTNKLDKLENKLILLITKDPSTPYRNILTEKDSPTEDVFNEIYTLSRLRKMSSKQKNLIKIFKEFDLIVADFRVSKFLPTVLGETFYVKNKKIPFLIQMAKPDPNAKLTKTAKSHKLKDERCDAKYVKGQMNSIARNTHVIIPAGGNSLSMKIGFIDWNTEKLIENINDVLKFFMEKHPHGGLIKSTKMIKNIQVKTSESVSLPVFEYVEEELSDSDSD